MLCCIGSSERPIDAALDTAEVRASLALMRGVMNAAKIVGVFVPLVILLSLGLMKELVFTSASRLKAEQRHPKAIRASQRFDKAT
jgi:hypothetical protein